MVSIGLIDELGRDIERAWQRVNLERAAFAELCAEKLEAARLHERVVPEEIVRTAFHDPLPQQSDPMARFGQPPVTLFRSRRFYIDALFWVDGTTAIHDHGFSGAFQVLSGQSIETNYSFEPLRDVDGHLGFGELRADRSALRGEGDVRAIPAGPGYIHALFHLARPSVSLVVRTFRDPAESTQREYSPGGVGYDSFLDDPVRDRMVQIVQMLRKIEHPAFEQIVGDLISTVDLNTGFAIIRSCSGIPDGPLIERLIERIRDPEGARRISVWLAYRKHIDFVVGKRASIREPSLRFMLAILLNVRRRADALNLIAAYVPGCDPGRQLAAWLCELSKTTIKLSVRGVPFEPNVFGLPTFAPGCEQAAADLFSGRERAWIPDEV
jgi:hypothetical protein